jgi:hypothetical protein
VSKCEIKKGDYVRIRPEVLRTMSKASQKAFGGRLLVTDIEGGVLYLSNEKSYGLNKITIFANSVRKA